MIHSCFLRDTSLTELAAVAGLSRFHFLRVFRAETGFTPHSYLIHLRVHEAKRQLARGRRIAEAAANCGFADQSHLARRFKQVLGITPGQYQMAARQQCWEFAQVEPAKKTPADYYARFDSRVAHPEFWLFTDAKGDLLDDRDLL